MDADCPPVQEPGRLGAVHRDTLHRVSINFPRYLALGGTYKAYDDNKVFAYTRMHDIAIHLD